MTLLLLVGLAILARIFWGLVQSPFTPWLLLEWPAALYLAALGMVCIWACSPPPNPARPIRGAGVDGPPPPGSLRRPSPSGAANPARAAPTRPRHQPPGREEAGRSCPAAGCPARSGAAPRIATCPAVRPESRTQIRSGIRSPDRECDARPPGRRP